MAQRQYEPATVFNARIVDMRHLWEPSREYQGKPSAKPNYFASFIVQKTQPQWFTDPGVASIAAACGKIYQNNPHVVAWPVIDGDMPNHEGKMSEWAKGHWIFSASTSNVPNVEIVQAGGAAPVKLLHKVGVKSGDFCLAGVTAAVKQNDPRGVKLYLNAVVFSGPGEEIVFANSVSGAELMRQAEAQGMRPAGFSASPGGFPQGGGAPFGAPSGGFTPGNAAGFAPSTGVPAPAFGAPNQPTGPAFPSNGGAPFTPPQGGPFGPR